MRALVATTLIASALVGVTPAVAAVPVATPGWTRCSEPALAGLDCGSIRVPLDYGDPSAGTLDIAMVRQPSTGTADERIGTLFFNVGGPGFSSIDGALADIARFPEPVLRRFDIVTWDPRGVGRSSGFECRAIGAAPPAAGSVDWSAFSARLRARIARERARCERTNAAIVPFMGTMNTVRDLDRMRAAVGDEQLSYLGFSYGSRIGYVYALEFPDRVRAIVEDGSVSPDATLAEFASGLTRASDAALGTLLQAYPDAGSLLDRVLDRLMLEPLPLPSGQRLTQWAVRSKLYQYLAYEHAYPVLVDWLRTVDDALNGTPVDTAVAMATLDAQEQESQLGALVGAEQFINCLDYADRPTPSEQDAINAATRRIAPIVGPLVVNMIMQCEGMVARPDPVPTRIGIHPGLPLLVVGSTRDGRTPFEWSVAMARAFPSGRLLSYTGSRHVAYPFARSECVNAVTNEYLIDLRLPAIDVSCPSVFAAPTTHLGN